MVYQKATDEIQRGGTCAIYDGELSWFLQESASVLGEQSSFGRLVGLIERGVTSGNHGSKGCGRVFDDQFDDVLLGWGEKKHSVGLIRRASLCLKSWMLLDKDSQACSIGRYLVNRNNLPMGVYGKLGDFAGVMWVVASRVGLITEIHSCVISGDWSWWTDRDKPGAKLIYKALVESHQNWRRCRAAAEK